MTDREQHTSDRPRRGEQQDVYRMLTPTGAVYGTTADSMDDAMERATNVMPHHNKDDLTALGVEQ